MAAARAEARRKAILSRGTDRLAKLTTSARGEDAPAYLHDDPPLPNLSAPKASNFLGEESSNMPTPQLGTPSPASTPRRASGNSTRSSVTPSRTAGTSNASSNLFEAMSASSSTPPDPSVWLPEQQQQFMQALMNASAGGPTSGGLPLSSPIGDPGGMEDSSMPPMDNPFAALMGLQPPGGGMGGGGIPGMGGMGGIFPPGMGGMSAVEPPKEKTRLQKALPLVHLVTMWVLLAYFVFWAEPRAYAQSVEGRSILGSLWARWAQLVPRGPILGIRITLIQATVQVMPFFWAFTTLQIVLHSLRIFSGFDNVKPPTLLALALPHLPPPIPSLVINSLKYMQMGSLFLDDLSGLLVGLGFIVYFSGWAYL